jgi:hypothetical protein
VLGSHSGSIISKYGMGCTRHPLYAVRFDVEYCLIEIRDFFSSRMVFKYTQTNSQILLKVHLCIVSDAMLKAQITVLLGNVEGSYIISFVKKIKLSPAVHFIILEINSFK